jgi:hypothetical protein
MSKFKIISYIFPALLWTGCGSSQHIIGSWANPEAKSKSPYSKVFVMVLSPNQDASAFFETRMAETLKSRGFKVVASLDMYPPNFALSENYTREQFAQALKETGCDAVLTLALLDSKIVESYHPGVVYSPMSYNYYGSYYGYYSHYYPQVYSPGYYSVDKTYYLETNFYDLASDTLLWSVQSEAKNPSDLEDGFTKYSTLMINHLKSKGLNQK